MSLRISAAALALCLLLSGCLAAAAVGAVGAVVTTTAKAGGAIVGAGVDAVTPDHHDKDKDHDDED